MIIDRTDPSNWRKEVKHVSVKGIEERHLAGYHAHMSPPTFEDIAGGEPDLDVAHHRAILEDMARELECIADHFLFAIKRQRAFVKELRELD